MPDIIDQIDSFSFGKTQLFVDKARLEEEVRLNLASFPGDEAGFTAENVNLLIGALQKAIARMEIALGTIVNNRRAIFYMWHDRQANLLRWSVISDLGQTKLPFCSNVLEVDIRTVVNEWAKPVDNSGLLSMNEIERMTTVEWRKITMTMGLATINAYVRRMPGTGAV